MTDPDIHVKGIFQDLGGEDLPSAGVLDDTVFDEEELIAEAERLVQIVEGGKDGNVLFFCQLFCLLDDQLLIGNIQIAGRLIKDHQLWVLRHCPGNGDLLLFTAGQRFGAAVGKFQQLHIPEDLFHGFVILLPGFHPEIGYPTHQHRVKHRQVAEMNVLGDIGDAPCPFPAVHFQQIFSVKGDRTAFRFFNAKDIFK